MFTFVKNIANDMTNLTKMQNKMKRILSLVIVMMTVAVVSRAAVYEPTLTSDSEVCVFFEANNTVTDAPRIWVWAGNTDGRSYVGTDWPGPEMTYMGDTPGGNKIYKWTYTGTLAMPTGLIYTWNNQGGRVDGSFTNHGYYVMGQLTRVIGAAPSTFVPNQNVIYQLDLYNFTSQGTLAAAQQRLDYLKDLGIDVIWLMPIHPRGVQGRIGSLGSPYAPRDYHAVNSDFGTLADLQAFVNAAHQRGMQVWLAWATPSNSCMRPTACCASATGSRRNTSCASSPCRAASSPTGEQKIGGVTYTYFDMGAANTGLAENLIFNNGEGSQLADYAYTIDHDIYLEVTATGVTEIDPSTYTGGGDTHYIYVDDQTGWDAITLYAWGDKEFFGDWPGAQPTGTKTVDGVNYTFWEFTSAGETEHLIFNNNGGGSQTPDFDVVLDRDYYLTVTAAGVTPK